MTPETPLLSADQTETEFELAQLASKGNELALQRLLLRNASRLARHVETKLPPTIQSVVGADDIVQQSFIEVFRHIRGFEPRGEGAFWGWLCTIAGHQILNTTKMLQRVKRGGGLRRVEVGLYSDDDLAELLSAGSHSPSKSVARHEAIQALHNAIEELPEDYGKAIRLRMMEGKSLEEIAQVVNRSPRAVQGLIDRAKKKMRAALGDLSLYQ